MRECMELGPSPAEEECAGIGDADYSRRNRDEIARYRELIVFKVGGESALPAGAELHRKGFPHEFGTYHELVCSYDDTDEEARAFAYWLEGNLPRSWGDNVPTPYPGRESRAS
jgi:hypothetical protein